MTCSSEIKRQREIHTERWRDRDTHTQRWRDRYRHTVRDRQPADSKRRETDRQSVRCMERLYLSVSISSIRYINHNYGIRTFRPRTFRLRTFRPRTFRPAEVSSPDLSSPNLSFHELTRNSYIFYSASWIYRCFFYSVFSFHKIDSFLV